MDERIDGGCPWPIMELFQKPYLAFSNIFGGQESVLDIACGNNSQRPILLAAFQKVLSSDVADVSGKTHSFSLQDIPADLRVSVAFSFETIEHLPEEDHDLAIANLKRVAPIVVIGSVNRDGPDFYKGHEIWKAKNGKNPYHLHEYGVSAWRDRFPVSEGWNHFGTRIIGTQLVLTPGIDENSYCNYAVLKQWNP